MNSLCRKIQTNYRTAAFALTVLAAIILIAGITSPAQTQTYPVAFPAPTTFATGCATCAASTMSVATGDLNGDGKLDVVTVDYGSNLNVMLGKGDGTFQTPIALNIALTNIFYEAITVGDFNGDHLLDVAVWAINATTGNMEVHIFLGNGTGSLTYSATYSAPNSNTFAPGPNSIVAADVNGDGKLDLVAMTPYNGVFVFMGNGDGTFQTPVANTTVCTSAIGNCGSLAVGESEWRWQARSRFPIQRYNGWRDKHSVEQRHGHIWNGDILPCRDLRCFCRRRHRHR